MTKPLDLFAFRPYPRPWTPAEDARLRDLAGRGLSQAQAGKALGRSRGSVAQRADRLNIQFDFPGAKRRAA